MVTSCSKAFKLPNFLQIEIIGFCLTTSMHKSNFHADHAHHTHNAQNWSVEPMSDFCLDPPLSCLKSYLTEVFRIVWLTGEIPNVCKKTCTVLVYLKGDQSDPANFRPITLERTPVKSVLRVCGTFCSHFYLLIGILIIAF